MKKEIQRTLILFFIIVIVFLLYFYSISSKKLSTINQLSPETQTSTITQSLTQISVVTPKEIVYGNKSKKEVIFTFDFGGPNLSGNKILEVLAKHQVEGTFFVTGKMAENYPDF